MTQEPYIRAPATAENVLAPQKTDWIGVPLRKTDWSPSAAGVEQALDLAVKVDLRQPGRREPLREQGLQVADERRRDVQRDGGGDAGPGSSTARSAAAGHKVALLAWFSSQLER